MPRRSASFASLTTRTRAVAYVRVSTEKQADHGVSLDAQRAKIEGYAALYDLDLVETIVDAGVSAKTLNRPGLARALAMLDAGKADALLVVKLDRLTRSVRDLGDLVERYFATGRAALLSVGEQIDTRTAGGRLVLNVLASVSQWEREAIGERTSVALQHKAARGEFTGGEAPYGFRVAADGATLEAHEAEQAVMAEARRLREAGLSLRAVAAELDRAGLRAQRARIRRDADRAHGGRMSPRPVDLGAVRGSRARLAALVRAHPELAGPSSPENRGAWEATLAVAEEGAGMPEETQQVGFRMPVALVEKIDAYAARMNAEHPGMSYSRADAARVLLARGLIAVGMLEAPKADAVAPKAEPKPQKGGKTPRKAK